MEELNTSDEMKEENSLNQEKTLREMWFQTKLETKVGPFWISVFRVTKESDDFEIEISRGEAFETKLFRCGGTNQVWKLQKILIKDAELYVNVLSRTGWVDKKGQRYPFEVGDFLVCEKRRVFKLERPLIEGESVLLLDNVGNIVNHCPAEDIYQCLNQNHQRTSIATSRDITTGELIYSKVIRFQKNKIRS